MRVLPTLRDLSRMQFSVAQWCLAAALIADIAALVVGVVGATSPAWVGWATLGLVVLALVAAQARAIGDRYSGRANEILRRLDLHEGLGRPIDPIIAADLVDDTPPFVQRWTRWREEDPYFGSTQPLSPRRLVENVRESSWWSKRLAGDMASAAWMLGAALAVLGILTLVAATNGLMSEDAVQSSAPWLSGGILLLISQSPLQARRRYLELRDGVERIQERAHSLLQSRQVNEIEALEIAADYHLVRQCAPVIPTAWYNHRRDTLNNLWRTRVQPSA
jgi:hypothetical protein